MSGQIKQGPHADWSPEAIRDFVARQAAAEIAMTTAFALCPAGLEGLAQALAMYDDGLSTAESTVESVRRILGIAKPVIPGSAELARDWAALYRGLPPGAASDLATGG